MPFSALAPVPAAALLHAPWNSVAGRSDGDDRFVPLAGGVVSPAARWRRHACRR